MTKKVNNTIDREKFCELVVTGSGTVEAYIAAGGKENKGTRHAASKYKKHEKTQELFKAKTLEIAHEAILDEARLAPLAIVVLQEILEDKNVDVKTRKQAADSVLNRVGSILPKELNINTHSKTVEVDINELARQLIESAPAASRSITEAFAGEVIDVEPDATGDSDELDGAVQAPQETETVS